jgi:DNA-binding transcriptional MerR regulator
MVRRKAASANKRETMGEPEVQGEQAVTYTKTMPYHFTISKFGKLTGLTPKALRLYEREGLLRPDVVDEKTGYRYYAQAQAEVAERIRLLRSIDMPLDDIRVVLSRRGSRAMQDLLRRHEQRIETQLVSYHEALHVLRELRTRDIQSYKVATKKVAAQPVIYMRQQTSLPQIETTRQRAFGELYGFLRQENLRATGPGFSANASSGKYEPHEDLNIEAEWLIDVCVPVARGIKNRRVASRVFPAGNVAYVIHTGPYEPLFQVYKKIAGWLKEQGLTPTGQTREIYHLSLTDTKQRNHLKTEIQFYLA